MQMKLKKVLTTLMIVASMSLTSQAAFASEVAPYVTGIGDTQNSAITALPNQWFSLFLSNAQDQDWYKWTNDTGVAKKATGQLFNKGTNSALRLGLKIDYNDGSEPTSILYSKYGEKGAQQTVANLYIPPGATVYAVVDSVIFATEQYDFVLFVY